MEVKSCLYCHTLSAQVEQRTTGYLFDCMSVNSEVMITKKQMSYLAGEMSIKIKSCSSQVIVSEEGLIIEYDIIIDDKNNIYAMEDNHIRKSIKEGIEDIKHRINIYLTFIESGDDGEASSPLSTEYNSKRFIELIKNENKKARIQLVKNEDSTKNPVRDIDIYNEKEDVIFENYQVFGLINENQTNIIVKIKNATGSKITLSCAPELLRVEGMYDRLHELKHSSKSLTFFCRAVFGEVTKTYEDYQLTALSD